MQPVTIDSKFRTKTSDLSKESRNGLNFLFLKGAFDLFDGFSFKRAKLFQAGCQLFIHLRRQRFGTEVKIEFINGQFCIKPF